MSYILTLMAGVILGYFICALLTISKGEGDW